MTNPWKSHCNLWIKAITVLPEFKERGIRLSPGYGEEQGHIVEEHVRWEVLSSLENTSCDNVVVVVVLGMLLLITLKLVLRMANIC